MRRLTDRKFILQPAHRYQILIGTIIASHINT